MTTNPDQDQPGPRPEPQVGYDELGVTDSPTVEQHAQMDTDGASSVTSTDEQTSAEDLKGQALDKALEDAGLPKTGTADEKRERLAREVGDGDTSGSK